VEIDDSHFDEIIAKTLMAADGRPVSERSIARRFDAHPAGGL
jgi:hypothetical protein